MATAIMFNCDPINGIDMAIVSLKDASKIELDKVYEREHFMAPELVDWLVPTMTVWKPEKVFVVGPAAYIGKIAGMIAAEYPNIDIVRKEKE